MGELVQRARVHHPQIRPIPACDGGRIGLRGVQGPHRCPALITTPSLHDNPNVQSQPQRTLTTTNSILTECEPNIFYPNVTPTCCITLTLPPLPPPSDYGQCVATIEDHSQPQTRRHQRRQGTWASCLTFLKLI